MQPHRISVGPLATADADGIALAQALGAAGPLTLNGVLASGGVATLDVARRVALTSVGNDSARTWTVTGTARDGLPQSETLAAANAGAVGTALDYKTVTKISLDGAAAGNVSAGTSATASSGWARLDEYASGETSIQSTVSGTVTYAIEASNDDPNAGSGSPAPHNVAWWPFQDGLTAGFLAEMTAAPLWVRLTVTAGSGSVRAVVVQHSDH